MTSTALVLGGRTRTVRRAVAAAVRGAPHRGPEDLERIERIATEPDERLDVVVTPR